MTNDTFRIDSHKLMLHPRRVADWLEGKDIAPIYMEVSPSGACNHRCVFCALDYMGYQPRFLDHALWASRVTDLAYIGLKSIMFAGEGEPFLNKSMPEIAEATKQAGIDIAFTTNGVLLTPDKAERVLPLTSWIKVSCNAGSAQSYAKVHTTQADDFETALCNIEQAITIRSKQGGHCTIGVQMLLLPANRHEATSLARRARDIGADYLVIKPYSIGRLSKKTEFLDLHYGDCSALAQELTSLNTVGFSVIFRHEAMSRREQQLRPYAHCHALPFWAYMDSGGNVWGCLRHIGEKDFLYGNLLEQPADEIFCGQLRRQAVCRAESTLDISDCQIDCRMDPINSYLWELKHPGPHVNFV